MSLAPEHRQGGARQVSQLHVTYGEGGGAAVVALCVVLGESAVNYQDGEGALTKTLPGELWKEGLARAKSGDQHQRVIFAWNRSRHVVSHVGGPKTP